LKKAWTAILPVVCILAACNRPSGQMSESNQDAIKALGSTVPATQFDRTFWQREHDANSSAWNEAKRLCGQTVLANYPNCLPVNDIVQADLRNKAAEANKAVAKSDQMFKRGYQYDFARKEWLPYHEMQAAGCIYAYPRPGHMTWQCPPGLTIPRGIADPEFGKEDE